MARRILVGALSAAVGWLLLDLLIRRDLPGAAALQHLAFRTLVGPLEWLTEGDGHRLPVALGAWLFVLTSAALAPPERRWRRAVIAASAAAVVLGEAVAVAVACLMERGLALGVAAGVALWAWRRGTDRVERRPAAVLLALATISGAAALYTVYAMFMSRGEGYPLLQRLGDGLRRGGTSYFALWACAVAALGALAAAVPGRGARSLIPAALVAAAVGAIGSPAASVLVGPAAVALVAGLVPGLAAVRGPLRGPALGGVACVVAGLLLGHTYAARVLACPGPADGGVRLLSRPGEIFRLARGAGDVLALSLRADQRVGILQPSGEVGWGADPAPGIPEELVYAPSRDTFYASFVPFHPEDFGDGPTAPNNVLVSLSGDGRRLLDAAAVPDLCWINTLHWSDPEGLLYIGCEDRPGLHRWSPERGLRDANLDPRIGDVQDIAFAADGSVAWTISLWFSRSLTELRRDDLAIVRQVPLGGSNYHLASDPSAARLYASSYYGGRVRVLDARSLRRVASLPAGFGTREVVVEPSRHLLLASSTYSGRLSIWSTEGEGAPRSLGSVQVGGHVKDIALDPARGLGWTWSQCGLLELDLDRLAAGAR